MCLSKRRWGRRERAERALDRRLAVGLGGSAYRCPLCGGWHITSRVGKKSDLDDPDDDEMLENFSGKFDDI